MTRTAADIGAGLDPVRAPRKIRPGERIHVVGAAGAGASAAALLASGAGAVVSGCDSGGPSPYTPALETAGILVSQGHDPSHVTTPPHPDRLAVTKALTAIDPNHPELAAARVLGIPVEPWQQVIADAAVGRTLVAVAGTHGKSTTAGWLTHVLAAAGTDPSAFVGALLPSSITGGVASTVRAGRGPAFVVEADEYAGNFDAYRPSIVVLTNIEWDHPDVFADRAAVIEAFEGWLRGLAGVKAPTLVANTGDEGVYELIERLRPAWRGRIVPAMKIGPARRWPSKDAIGAARRFASESGPAVAILGRIIGSDPRTTSVNLFGDGFGRLYGRPALLPTAGGHNVENAICVAAAAVELAIDPSVIVSGLASFEGVGRRLEQKGEAGGVVVYDDYGHHPTAIRETIAAVRQREPGRPLWAVYEPLTFHRTAALLDDFAGALALADGVAIADIWAGRDPDRTVASAEGLARAVRSIRPEITAEAPGSVEATATWLASHVKPGDAVLVMGGGRSYRIGELVLDSLRGESG